MQITRQHPRYPIQLPVHLFGDLGGGEGITVNVGLGGCAVATRSPHEKGSYVSLVMRSSHDQLPIKIELAVVRWAKDDVFGVEFIRIKSEQRTRLGQYLHVLELSHGR